jgi:hypothetical protein
MCAVRWRVGYDAPSRNRDEKIMRLHALALLAIAALAVSTARAGAPAEDRRQSPAVAEDADDARRVPPPVSSSHEPSSAGTGDAVRCDYPDDAACDDGDACTIDVCTPLMLCGHTLDPACYPTGTTIAVTVVVLVLIVLAAPAAILLMLLLRRARRRRMVARMRATAASGPVFYN